MFAIVFGFGLAYVHYTTNSTTTPGLVAPTVDARGSVSYSALSWSDVAYFKTDSSQQRLDWNED